MKNKILLSIVVVLLPITIFMLKKQVAPLNQDNKESLNKPIIYIDLLINRV